MEIISQPLDFMGLNTYGTCGVVQAGLGNRPHEPHFPRTDMDWPVTPDALYWAVRTMTELYAPKAIYITENGAAYPDQVNVEGRVDDFARVEFLRSYLRGVERAVSEGYPLRGYFLWSFLDNFEWQQGYAKRFGIVHVDRETQRRTPKASYEWYRWYIAKCASASASPQ
jgi:beta-glucosidase